MLDVSSLPFIWVCHSAEMLICVFGPITATDSKLLFLVCKCSSHKYLLTEQWRKSELLSRHVNTLCQRSKVLLLQS